MTSKKLALAVSVGIIAVSIMGGCSSTQTMAKQSTSQNQFIEVHVVNKKQQYINLNHIVTVYPNGDGAIILMDTSDGMSAFITVSESYEQIGKELGIGTQTKK